MYPSVFILIFALAVKNVFPYSAEYTVTIGNVNFKFEKYNLYLSDI